MTSSVVMATPAAPLTSTAGSSSTSSSSQYLHPDYIQLMPSSFDSKNSPLALLAQTCNSIGKDPTPPPSNSTSSSKPPTSSSATSSSSSSGTTAANSAFDRKDYHSMNGIGGSRAKSESPTNSGMASRAGNAASSGSGKSSAAGRDRGSHHGHLHRTSGSSGGGSKHAGGTSPASKSGRRDDADLSTANRMSSDGGKPTAAAAVVSGQPLGKMAAVLGAAGGCPVPPTATEFEAQLARYAVIQHQLSLAAAAAAAVSSSRIPPPPSSLYPPLSSLYGSAAAASGRPSPFPDLAAAAAIGLHAFSAVPPGGGGVNASSAAAGLYSSGLGCLPLPPTFPPSLTSAATGSSAFPSLLDPLMQQAYINAAAAAAGISSPPTSTSSPFFDIASRFKGASATAAATPSPAAVASSTSAVASSTCKDPYCFRCQLAAAFQLPAGPCTGGLATDLSPGSTSGADKKSSSFANPSALLPPSMMMSPLSTSASPYLPLHAAMFLQQLQQQQFSSSSSVPVGPTSADLQSTSFPYVCSWVDGPTSEFCGKRFQSSDELLRHLRSHASSSLAAFDLASSSSSPSAISRLPLSAAQAAAAALQAAFGYPASAPNGSARLSPLPGDQGSAAACSALAAAAAHAYGSGGGAAGGGGPLSNGSSGLLLSNSRYHPYAKSGSALATTSPIFSPPTSVSSAAAAASLPGLPGLPLPTLGGGSTSPFQISSSSAAAAAGTPSAALQNTAFFSPYAAAVYGQRLGAAVVGP